MSHVDRSLASSTGIRPGIEASALVASGVGRHALRPVIERFDQPDQAREWCAAVRARGQSLGFVPTMGALHDGHLTLVRAAKAECARVCVSVFVNPLQFDDPRDFERYPRDLEGDARLVEGAGCDMLFTGSLEQFFPEAGGRKEHIASRDPGPAALGLEGKFRQ